MNLSDLKIKLGSFLSGDLKAETETMLETMGYVKKPEEVTPEPETVAPEVPAQEQVDVEKIKADAKAEALKEANDEASRVKEITEACILAGKESLLPGFIENKSMTVEAVKKQILDGRATDVDKNTTVSTVDPFNSGEVNPVIAEATRRRDSARA